MALGWLPFELAMECNCEVIEGYFAGLTTMAAEALTFSKLKQAYRRMVSMIVLEGSEDVEAHLRHLRRSS